jgi:hypothetical protein
MRGVEFTGHVQVNILQLRGHEAPSPFLWHDGSSAI